MRAAQSRAMSLVEAFANVAVGFIIAVLTQRAVFPLFGIQTDWSVDFAIGGLFTVVSIVRSYVMRRLFERIDTVMGDRKRRRRVPPDTPGGRTKPG